MLELFIFYLTNNTVFFLLNSAEHLEYRVIKWAPEETLMAIRWIEKAIYEDDGSGLLGPSNHTGLAGGPPGAGKLHDRLDEGMGSALHTALFEEAIDCLVHIPATVDENGATPSPLRQRGKNST